MWSIHDIEVLFHTYSSGADWRHGPTMALRESANRLHEAGLICQPGEGYQYVVTPKGEAFIQILLATPVPIAVEKFVDPRFEKADPHSGGHRP
jgi:hypothetical protein